MTEWTRRDHTVGALALRLAGMRGHHRHRVRLVRREDREPAAPTLPAEVHDLGAHRLDDPFQILLPLRLAPDDRLGAADVAALERPHLPAPDPAAARRLSPFHPL